MIYRCSLLYAIRVGEWRVFDRDLTKSMHCIVPSGSWGSSVIDRGLTKSMQCIVPCEGRGVEGFRRGSGPIRDSMVFDRGQTKYMHCIVPRERCSGVEGFSGGVY